MIYDTFEVKGNCRGCGKATEWHINGDYPVCRDCMKNLIDDFYAVSNENNKNDYIMCIMAIADYVSSHLKDDISIENKDHILNIIESYDGELGKHLKADVRN